jgi:hypothetical protein
VETVENGNTVARVNVTNLLLARANNRLPTLAHATSTSASTAVKMAVLAPIPSVTEPAAPRPKDGASPFLDLPEKTLL